jgi:hypothetical protein
MKQMDGKPRNGKQETLEKTYWTKQVAKTLGISDGCLRGYCLELERNGYIFVKVKVGKDREHRVFTEHDVIALQKFQELIRQPGMKRSTAVQIVVKKYNLPDRSNGTEIVPNPLLLPSARETFDRTIRRELQSKDIIKHILSVIKEIKDELDRMKNETNSRLGDLEKKIDDFCAESRQEIRNIQEFQGEKQVIIDLMKHLSSRL